VTGPIFGLLQPQEPNPSHSHTTDPSPNRAVTTTYMDTGDLGVSLLTIDPDSRRTIFCVLYLNYLDFVDNLIYRTLLCYFLAVYISVRESAGP